MRVNHSFCENSTLHSAWLDFIKMIMTIDGDDDDDCGGGGGDDDEDKGDDKNEDDDDHY